MIRKYTQNITVEAIQYDGDNETEIEKFSNNVVVRNKVIPFSKIAPDRDRYPEKMTCKTDIGQITVNKSDFIVKSADGEIFTCTAKFFKKMYMEIDKS